MEFHETKNPEEEVFEEKPAISDMQKALAIIARNERGRIAIELAENAKIAKKQEMRLQEKKLKI